MYFDATLDTIFKTFQTHECILLILTQFKDLLALCGLIKVTVMEQM